jgi:hypothetical protein
MSNERRLAPIEMLRRVALSLERLAAQGVASGAVRGATEELRAGMPVPAEQLRALFQDGLEILERLAHEAAERSSTPPGTWAHLVAEQAVQGAIEELKRSMPGLDALSRELVERVNRFLERSARVAASREEELRTPGFRARIAAAGAVEGAVGQLKESLPVLAPIASSAASEVGQGLVEGLATGARERADDFSALLDHAGRGLLHAIVDQLDAEVKARREAVEGDAITAAAKAAEHIAAATVRGATSELGRVLAALGQRLRRPLGLAAGASGALLLVTLIAVRAR